MSSVMPVGRPAVTPRVEPVPQVLAVGGWEACDSNVLLSALRVIAAGAHADVCCLAWAADAGAPRILDGGSAPPEAGAAEAWLEAAEATAGAEPVAVDGDVLVAPVRSPAGAVAGALAVGSGDGDTAAAAVRSGAQHLAQLLACSEADTERTTAYQALFDIGTQIQAQEVHADAIFALIVERARDLLRTDVAWLAMVDAGAQRLRMKVAVGTTTPDFMAMEVRVGTGIGGIALKERRPVAVHDSSIYGNGMPRAVHRALDDEGVTSILCAPMLRDDGLLGALYVGTRTPRRFTGEEASLLAALAAQAAVTIEDARLYQEMSQNHEALERAFRIHRQLTDASLAGVGLQRVALDLARLVDRDLVLDLEGGSPRRARYPRHPLARSPVPVAERDRELADRTPDVEIVAGDTELGALYALGADPVSPLERKALEHGATVIALELVKEQAALEVEWRLQGELLEELLRSPGALPEGVLRRAERFGVDLEAAHRIAVLQPRRTVATSALLELVRRGLRSRGHREGLVAQRGDRVLVALRDDQGDGARRVLEELQRAARRAGLPFIGGLSSPRTALVPALREAEGALAMAVGSAGHDKDLIVGHEDLGPLRFLLDAPDTAQMRAMVRDVLGPLAEHDARRHADLLSTLRAYLDCGGHHASTAERCHIHVSTLKYRLSRIAAILGRSLTDPTDRFELRLALEVLGVLEAVGAAPFADARAGG
jgi:DNA-binding PucR family transcriptional regulator/putative methionine-R-sulfoxide reductase with GAF domain